MDTATAAQTAGVTVATIRTWCRRNVVGALKVAGRWTIDAASLAYRITLGARKERKMVELNPENMVAIGGSRWQKAGKDRVYINNWLQYLGLELAHYKTGNIASAALDGEGISNGEAKRIVGAIYKVYLDAADGQLWIQWGDSEPRSMTRDEMAKRIGDGVRAAVAAL